MSVVATLVVSMGGTPPPRANATHRHHQHRHHHHHSCPAGLIALTFDDGPSASATPRLITYLNHQHVPATFFVVGERIPGNEHILRRMARAGFRIGNHTYHHEDLTKLSDSQIRETLQQTRWAIEGARVLQSPLMRPPYGRIDQRVREVAAAMRLVPVVWTIDSRDWTGISSSAIAHNVLSHLRSGPNIVLLHDGVANTPATLVALPKIVSSARHLGFCFRELGNRGEVQDSQVRGLTQAAS
jgi:peptidoglycan-N-acetylglucosamine deacetylase